MIAPHQCPYCPEQFQGRSIEEIHKLLVDHAARDHDIRLLDDSEEFRSLYTHSISVTVYVTNPEEWTEVWTKFTELSESFGQKYPQTVISSIDIREGE